YEHLARAGVKLFEGIWFAQPPAKADNAIKLSYASLINLLNMVMREAEVHEIEELLRREPTLSFKLLRYINSCGFGRHVEIASFRHAVMTVGMKRLFRWTALLIAGTPAGNVAPAAGTLAIVRGRVMELLALETLSPAEADLAFVTGMFSMLDVLLGMPLPDALALVNLPPSVSDAVLRGEGTYAGFLSIAKGCESADENTLEILSERYGISADRMISVHLEALAWGEQFGH
ncbi:MAG: HDOD domain-containing protein, partial [Variovorax sp.]